MKTSNSSYGDSAFNTPGNQKLTLTFKADTVKPANNVATMRVSCSAILVLKNLVEIPESSTPKIIYNFYNTELKNIFCTNGYILDDNTGG